MPNLRDFVRRWSRPRRSAWPPPRRRPSAAEQPVARGVGIGHRFERGERLGRDDEQRFGGVQVARGFGEVGAVDIRDKAEGHVAVGVGAQRFVRHHRAQIGAADADVDHVPNLLAGESQSMRRSGRGREVGHAVEHGVDIRDDVVAVDQDDGVARRAQGNVEHRAVFGDVDALARNIASVRSRSPHSCASWSSSLKVSRVMRCLE